MDNDKLATALATHTNSLENLSTNCGYKALYLSPTNKPTIIRNHDRFKLRMFHTNTVCSHAHYSALVDDLS